MKEYKAYLFDMDGTLVNSEKWKGQALSETCSLFGGKADIQIYKDVMGESWNNVTSYFFEKAKIDPDIVDFNRKFRKRYEELLLLKLTPNPNVESLLKQLKAKGKKLGLVSSASAWMIEQVLSQLDLFRFFDIIIGKEQVTSHKPDPEAFLLALDQLSLSPSEVLVFEDSSAGIIAANRAQCDTIAFKHAFNANNDLSMAMKIITDYKEILE